MDDAGVIRHRRVAQTKLFATRRRQKACIRSQGQKEHTMETILIHFHKTPASHEMRQITRVFPRKWYIFLWQPSLLWQRNTVISYIICNKNKLRLRYGVYAPLLSACLTIPLFARIRKYGINFANLTPQ